MRLARPLLPALLLLAATAMPAMAHTTGSAHIHGGLLAGLAHPFSGWDHLLAMLAVGAWASQLGGRAVLAAPAAFVAALVLGAVLAMGGVELPAVETGILASLVVAGLLIALAVRLPLVAGVGIVALFGLFHGHAHGTELPEAAAPALYALGFVTASVILHVIGVGLGTAARSARAERLLRFGGGAVAAAGVLALIAG